MLIMTKKVYHLQKKIELKIKKNTNPELDFVVLRILLIRIRLAMLFNSRIVLLSGE